MRKSILVIPLAALLLIIVGIEQQLGASGVQALATLFVGTTPIVGGSSGDCLGITTGVLSSGACGGAPSGAAGGDLSGTYPNPTVAKVNGNTPGGTCQGIVASAVINSGGTGYSSGNTFTINGGGSTATGMVSSVGGGVVFTITITNVGRGYGTGSAIATTATSGTGTGLTLDITAINSFSQVLSSSAIPTCAALPSPTATTLGGAKTIGALANNFLTAFSATGAFTQARPTCANLSTAAASCSTDTTNAANITSGLLPNARLPVFASLTAATGNIANTETVVTSFTAPANLFTAGAQIRYSAAGSCTTSVTPGTSTWRARIGPTTLTGTAFSMSSPTLIVSQTSKHFDIEGYLIVRSVVTTTATMDSEATIFADPAILVFGASNFGGSAGGTFDPTVQNLVEMTFQSPNAGSSCTFFSALLEQVI